MRIIPVRRRTSYQIIAFLVVVFFFIYCFKKTEKFQNKPIKTDFLPSQSELIIRSVNKIKFNGPRKQKDNITAASDHLVINGIIVVKDINYQIEDQIKKDEDAIVAGLGEYGEPALVINEVSQRQVDECIKKEAFNRILSDKISLTRKIPDARHPKCAELVYDDVLPTTSVIIIFTNEAWSSLMRTVHTTLIRSPERVLKEIILVDDASTNEELHDKLEYYVYTRLPGHVKLIRLAKRSGLIRARLAGARAAIGDVLVFLDSHCEVGINWLEPMLQRIKEKSDAVVMPIIDVIDDKHMGYMFNRHSYDFQVGSFTWSGHFTWINIPEREKVRRGSPIAPTRSPTMAGGLFAIDKNYFWHIGSYDPKMEIWGGENLEFSFRIWQCGGTLEIIPCSRVGHIFRSFHPYSFDGKGDSHGYNTARMVEVWMDDYKRLFYYNRPDLKKTKIGDIKARVLLRKNLKCKDFRWYLKNVVPEKFILDENVQAYGRVKARQRRFCFDTLQHPEDKSYNLGVYSCHNQLLSSQYFSLSNEGEIRREQLCAEVAPLNMHDNSEIYVTMNTCNSGKEQKWIFTKRGLLKNDVTKLCISWKGLKSNDLLTVTDCRVEDYNIKWDWEYIIDKSGNVVRNPTF